MMRDYTWIRFALVTYVVVVISDETPKNKELLEIHGYQREKSLSYS